MSLSHMKSDIISFGSYHLLIETCDPFSSPFEKCVMLCVWGGVRYRACLVYIKTCKQLGCKRLVKTFFNVIFYSVASSPSSLTHGKKHFVKLATIKKKISSCL